MQATVRIQASTDLWGNDSPPMVHPQHEVVDADGALVVHRPKVQEHAGVPPGGRYAEGALVQQVDIRAVRPLLACRQAEWGVAMADRNM